MNPLFVGQYRDCFHLLARVNVCLLPQSPLCSSQVAFILHLSLTGVKGVHPLAGLWGSEFRFLMLAINIHPLDLPEAVPSQGPNCHSLCP